MALSVRQFDAFFADEMEYGQLCDIVVPRASVECWVKFLRVIAAHYPYEFFVGGSVVPIPDNPAPLLMFVDGEPPELGLTFTVEGLAMRALFTIPALIEIDTYRRDVKREHHQPLKDLMRHVGDALQRDVFMTPESNAAESVLVYEWRHRRFRTPAHGEGTDGHLRAKLFAALKPTLTAIVSRSQQHPSGAESDLVALRDAVERTIESFDELALQDHLTVDDRRNVDKLWSLLATLAAQEQEGRSQNYWATAERDLAHHVAQLLRE